MAGTPTRRSRGGLVLVILAVGLLLVGAIFAAVGLSARGSAQDRADRADQSLIDANADRDSARSQRDDAVEQRDQAQRDQAAAAEEAQQVQSVLAQASTAVDQLTDCNARLEAATNQIIAAVQAGDQAGASAAIDSYNLAVDDCNAAIESYNAAVAQLYGGAGGGSATA